MGEVNLNIP